MTIDSTKERLANHGQHCLVGEITMDGDDRRTYGLHVISVPDYDGQSFFFPILIEKEADTDPQKLMTQLGVQEYSQFEATQEQKQKIVSMIDKYKIPWPIAFYMVFNRPEIELEQIKEPAINQSDLYTTPSMVTVAGEPSVGKSAFCALTYLFSDLRGGVWLVGAAPWERKGVRATDYASVLEEMFDKRQPSSLEEALEIIRSKRPIKDLKTTIEPWPVKSIFNTIVSNLITTGERSRYIVLDPSGEGNEIPFEPQHLIHYCCFSHTISQPGAKSDAARFTTYDGFLRLVPRENEMLHRAIVDQLMI